MASESAKVDKPGLGTFSGVFTPSILTILGIILFLRLGYVIGGSGLGQALVIIGIANVISLLTSLSVAAISTNFIVKGGGDYYLISRTLGIGFGGAIGLVLFLAQSISVGFYCMGFAEAGAAIIGQHDGVTIRLFGGGAVLALAVLAWLGADWATKFQFVVMAALGAGLVSFAAGAFETWSGEQVVRNWAEPPDGIPLWVAFAIFFPAVTGFTQGVSMSGDLARPARSIPTGVISAVLLSLVVYLACAIGLAGTLPGEVLRANNLAMKNVSVFPALIDAGLVAAALSSALASFLGGPRILQSLAKDEVFPRLEKFAAGSGPGGNPRRAVVFTGIIGMGVVALGDLNLIASVVSMFFLISYGLLNYATYFEARSSSPSFRPTFRFYHPYVGLAGALACLGAMIAIDVGAGIAASAIVFGIYQYIQLREIPARWADSRRSHHLKETRVHLLAAAASEAHPRDWRPQLLVFSDSPERRSRLLKFSSWLEGGGGLTTVVRVLEGHGADVLEKREKALKDLQGEIKKGEFTAFPLVVAGEQLDQTIATVIQSSGIGPLRANTVVANWIEGRPWIMSEEGERQFSRNLRSAFRLGCNLLVLDSDAQEWEALKKAPAKDRVVDVMWRANKTGELMLLLAYIVTRAAEWRGAKLRVLVEPESGEGEEQTIERLKTLLDEFRIEAEVVVFEGKGEGEGVELMARSRESSLVFLPFSTHSGRFYGPFGGELAELLRPLPVVALTLAAQDVDLAADPDIEEGDAPEEEKEEKTDVP
jgi:amino acid transporter